MARASCERGNFEMSIRTLGVMLLIADGWKITAGDPVVLGFIFVFEEMEQIAMLFKYFQSAPC
jgi:hypothetical protein